MGTSEIIELLKQEKFYILFLTETDIIINDEEDLKINGFKTFFQTRKTSTDKIRIIALVCNNIAQNIKVLEEVMSSEFPSIWFQLESPNGKPICIAGFYRQWSHNGDKRHTY